MKTKKLCDYESRDFLDKKFPKVGSNYYCLAVLLFDLALKNDENYVPHVFLK